MRTSRFSDEQIVGIVEEHEAGARPAELCRRHGISPATLYTWRARHGGKRRTKRGGERRSRHGGVTVPDAGRLGALEEENRRLKQLLAEAMLDNQALKGLLAKSR